MSQNSLDSPLFSMGSIPYNYVNQSHTIDTSLSLASIHLPICVLHQAHHGLSPTIARTIYLGFYTKYFL
jgi:hypothetical protein